MKRRALELRGCKFKSSVFFFFLGSLFFIFIDVQFQEIALHLEQ